MNVSSGLAFVSLAKALRHQLKDTKIDVVEIIPPAVRTNLGGSHDFGEPLDEFADAVPEQLREVKEEVTNTFSSKTSQASRQELDEIFKRMNSLTNHDR